MNGLQIFTKKEFGAVRVVEHNGEPWFVASDVAKALGYENPANAVNIHCKKTNKITLPPDSGGRENTAFIPPIQINIISESDVYRLVMRSNLPGAVEFQDWICEEVIPALRKRGFYGVLPAPASLPNFADPVEAARAWADKEEQRRIEQAGRLALEQKMEEVKPKVIFADSVASSDTLILIRQLAKVLQQNGVDIGGKRLFDWMREKGFLVKNGRDNEPTQRAMELGLFRLVEVTVTVPEHAPKTRMTPKITGKGQLYFINLFKKMAKRAA